MKKNISEEMIQKLLNHAKHAAEFSYSPYSHFRVGAALLTDNDKIYTGTNIENRSYGATICAEQTAIVKAVSEGEKKIKALCVVGLDSQEFLSPCGICRQIISEFGLEMPIIMANHKMQYEIKQMKELFPNNLLENFK